MNINELHFTGQETHIERGFMQLAQSHRGDSMEELSAKHSLSPTVRLFYQVQSCMYFIFVFNLHLVEKKRGSVRPESNTASLTAHEHVRNPVLYTANRVEGGFLNHTRHMSERAHPERSLKGWIE